MSTEKKVTVSSTEDLRNALAAGYEASQIEVKTSDNSAALAEARAAGVEEGRKVAAPELVAAERARISAVQKLSRPGFEAIVSKGVEDGTSPADIALAIMTAAADRGITLDAIRKDAPPAAPHAAPADTDPKAAKSWDDINAKVIAQQRM